MPIHDWTRVPAGLFHDFHQSWSIRIKDALNAGRLPKGLSALVEQRAGVKEADVLAVEARSRTQPLGLEDGGVLTLEPPSAQIVRRTTNEAYARRANRIVVKHHLGRTIAVIEIVSPGNKDNRAALRDFVDKSVDFLQRGIHLVIVDLFPPTPRDPDGMHKAIWDQFVEEPFPLQPGRDRLVVSYESGDEKAYVEPLGVGDILPEAQLFLVGGMHVKVPLEATYQATWDATPEEMRRAVETGMLPE